MTFVGRAGGAALRIRDSRKRVSIPIAVMRSAWSEAIPKQVVVS
jgi:hypothetical protein